jgi:hypothetical protein
MLITDPERQQHNRPQAIRRTRQESSLCAFRVHSQNSKKMLKHLSLKLPDTDDSERYKELARVVSRESNGK